MVAEEREAEAGYKSPPITEAVIEIRFADLLSQRQLEDLSGKFDSSYPDLKVVPHFNVNLDLTTNPNPTQAPVKQTELSYRRASFDQREIIVLGPGSLLVSQVAPYTGWTTFFTRFNKDWNISKRLTGYRKIARIGVRFINRIDIAFEDGVINHEDYFRIYPNVPEELGPINYYNVNIMLPLSEINGGARINSSNIPSPLIGHSSFMLDIDIIKETELPQSDDGLFEYIATARGVKNRIFESCITDKAREMFRK